MHCFSFISMFFGCAAIEEISVSNASITYAIIKRIVNTLIRITETITEIQNVIVTETEILVKTKSILCR